MQSAAKQLEQKIKALVRKAKIIDAQENRCYGKRSCCPKTQINRRLIRPR